MLKKIFIIGFSILLCNCTLTAFAELRDPTQPADANIPSAANVIGKDLQVNAVFFSTGRYVAIINGTLSRQDDIIKGYRILSIQPYAVKFRGPEGVFVKRIVSPPVKYPIAK